MRLYIGKLPSSATEADLRRLFEPYEPLESLRLIADRDTGRSRGFAFAEISDPQAAKNAMANLNGKSLNGHTIEVNEAKPQRDRNNGPGGYRSNFGGSRNGDFGNSRGRQH